MTIINNDKVTGNSIGSVIANIITIILVLLYMLSPRVWGTLIILFSLNPWVYGSC